MHCEFKSVEDAVAAINLCALNIGKEVDQNVFMGTSWLILITLCLVILFWLEGIIMFDD